MKINAFNPFFHRLHNPPKPSFDLVFLLDRLHHHARTSHDKQFPLDQPTGRYDGVCPLNSCFQNRQAAASIPLTFHVVGCQLVAAALGFIGWIIDRKVEGG